MATQSQSQTSSMKWASHIQHSQMLSLTHHLFQLRRVQRLCVSLSLTALSHSAAVQQWMPARLCGFSMSIRKLTSRIWLCVSAISVREFTHSRRWVRRHTSLLSQHHQVQVLRLLLSQLSQTRIQALSIRLLTISLCLKWQSLMLTT